MIQLPQDLGNGYVLEEMTIEEFNAVYTSRQEEYFKTSLIVDVTSHLSTAEQHQAQQRRTAFPAAWRMQWAVMQGGGIVGWTYAYQQDHETLYMCNTAIDPAHRRKGLYTSILRIVLDYARANGFQIVTSKHYASNNAVIVPKLKAGFIISGMALDEKYGLMIHLTKYLHPQREAIAINRIGETR